MSVSCCRAEILAGAIALNEATEGERDAYRRHLAHCARCIESFGGEREIERTMTVVAAARDSETWEPGRRLAGQGRAGGSRRQPALRLAVTAAVLAAGAYAALLANWQHPAQRPAATIALAPALRAMPGIHWERRLLSHLAQRKTPRVRLIVVHNVVTLKRPHAASPSPAPLPAAPARPRGRITNGAPAAAKAVIADAGFNARPPSERDRSSVSSLRTTAGTTPTQRAESLAVVAPSVIIHDVFPLGGDTAIVPRPAPIAYSENAEGTTAFEVSIDDRGVPLKCTITKASGYLVLDEAVCRAAMRARYSPRTIDGRPVTGVYRDAFTFRRSQDQ